MEMDSKKQTYLQYFQKSSNSVTLNQNYNKLTSKILPHIAQQYHYRITNNLLIKKITDPKRDRIIQNSLQKTRKYLRGSTSLKNRDHRNKRLVNTSLNFRTGSIKRRNNQVSMEGNSYQQQQQEEEVEEELNQKEIQRRKNDSSFMNNLVSLDSNGIHNETEDYICESTMFKKNNAKYHKIKNDTCHFNRSDSWSKNKQNSQNQSFHGESLLRNNNWFGNGPTILLISHLQISSNPQLRSDTLLQLQLVQRLGIGKYVLHNNQVIAQKVIKTRPITCMNLPDGSRYNNIKFAIKVSKIGDFVPLRIWKYIGVDCIEVGTVDLPLNIYKMKHNFLESEYHNLKWQFTKNKEVGRRVLIGQVKCQLRKGQKIQINTKVIIKYKIYSKKYTRIKSPQAIDKKL